MAEPSVRSKRVSTSQVSKGIRSAQIGVLVNTVLAVLKLVAGIVGNTYALIADAVESTADIFSSLVVWGGLHVSGREPDDEYPFGYGKAEALAAAVVSLMLLGAAIGIAFQAVQEIRESLGSRREVRPATLLHRVSGRPGDSRAAQQACSLGARG